MARKDALLRIVEACLPKEAKVIQTYPDSGIFLLRISDHHRYDYHLRVDSLGKVTFSTNHWRDVTDLNDPESLKVLRAFLQRRITDPECWKEIKNGK